MKWIKRGVYIFLFLLAAGAQPGTDAGATEARLGKTIHEGALQDLISVSAQNIDINEFLKGISKTKKVNIITSSEVSGTISVNLYNVPLEEVLKAVCLSNGYQWTRQKDIFYIFKRKGKQKNIQAIDTVVKSFRVNFADIGEVRNVIDDLIGADGFTVHEEAKTVIVEDIPENVAKIGRVLKQIDYAPRQVLIEAKILEIRLTEELSLGVDWETTFTGDYIGDISTQGFSLPSNTEGAQGFFFDVVKDNQKLRASLDALESRSDINVLATPKLLALDGKEAEIIIGGTLGYYLVTTTETSTLQSVEFLDIGTQLKLTPQISQDGKILMEIHPEVSDGSVDALGLPSTTTTEVTTSLMAEDGDTIFIGGLIREGKEKLKSKVPFLGSIPLLGRFFGRTQDRVFKNEIVILITPYLVSPEHQPVDAALAGTVSRAEQVLDEEENTAEKLFNNKKMFEEIRSREGLDSLIKKEDNIPSGAAAPGKTTDPVGRNVPEQAEVTKPAKIIKKAAVPPVKADVLTRREAVKKEAVPVQGSTLPLKKIYTILVGTFSVKENAKSLNQTLQAKGYPSFVLAEIDSRGKPVDVVKIGPLESYETACELASRFEKEEGTPAVILTKISP